MRLAGWMWRRMWWSFSDTGYGAGDRAGGEAQHAERSAAGYGAGGADGDRGADRCGCGAGEASAGECIGDRAGWDGVASRRDRNPGVARGGSDVPAGAGDHAQCAWEGDDAVEGVAHGSGRSIAGFHLLDALTAVDLAEDLRCLRASAGMRMRWGSRCLRGWCRSCGGAWRSTLRNG